jgi:hypothetical protein
MIFDCTANLFIYLLMNMFLRDAPKILSDNGQADLNTVISMETSIGYFGEGADYQLFKDLASISSYSTKSSSSSAPSPIFIVETMNRDYLIREFEPFYIVDISEQKLELHIKRKLNLESSSMDEEFIFKVMTRDYLLEADFTRGSFYIRRNDDRLEFPIPIEPSNVIKAEYL